MVLWASVSKISETGQNLKILALGTSCVDVYPQKGIVTPGGEALNIAAQLSLRTDVQIYLMGLIGRDTYADAVVESIKDLKLDTSHLYQVDGKTAHHVIQIDKQGDRFFESGSWHGGVSADFSFNNNDRALLSEMEAVITTLWEPNLNELLKLKTDNDYLVAVDFNDQRDFAQWEKLIGKIDIFFVSAEQSMKTDFLHRSKTSESIFLLTFGEHGSVAYDDGHVFECPAVTVEHVVDTTGCGDCYLGHFVAEYIKTRDIPLSMKRATQEAAKVTGYVGGFPTNR